MLNANIESKGVLSKLALAFRKCKEQRFVINTLTSPITLSEFNIKAAEQVNTAVYYSEVNATVSVLFSVPSRMRKSLPKNFIQLFIPYVKASKQKEFVSRSLAIRTLNVISLVDILKSYLVKNYTVQLKEHKHSSCTICITTKIDPRSNDYPEYNPSNKNRFGLYGTFAIHRIVKMYDAVLASIILAAKNKSSHIVSLNYVIDDGVETSPVFKVIAKLENSKACYTEVDSSAVLDSILNIINDNEYDDIGTYVRTYLSLQVFNAFETFEAEDIPGNYVTVDEEASSYSTVVLESAQTGKRVTIDFSH